MTTMAEEHTGGMVALVPRAADAEQLRVSGGEKLDELHLTLVYLGDDVTEWSADQRNNLTARALDTALSAGAPVTARIVGPGVFNPDGHEGRSPCAVYLVGDSKMITPMRDRLIPLAEYRGQEQHEPFLPHVTAGYGVPFGRLKYTGPVVFDRLRVAFAGDIYDFPLGEVDEKALAENFLVSTIGEDLPDGADDLVELKLMSPDPGAAKLREYWAHGEGRAKWDKWRELRRHLKKYVKSPHVLDGLTSNIYRLAKGHNPPRGTKGFELSEIELKAAMALADPDADFDPGALADWLGDDEETDEFDENDPVQVYEQALVDDVDWDIDAEGALVREDEDDEQAEDEEIPSGPRVVDPGVSLWDLAESD